MVATAVLSLGLGMIYQAFFVCMDAFDYYLNHLNVQLWLDEMIWAMQDDFRQYGFFQPSQTSGDFIMANRDFHWSMGYNALRPDELYEISLKVSWRQGARNINLPRTAYISYYASE